MTLVPSQSVDLLVSLPFPADTDNRPLLQDVVMGDGYFVARPPRQDYIGTGFDVEKQPTFIRVHKFILFRESCPVFWCIQLHPQDCLWLAY